jgi:hypothetical protein
MRCEYYQQTGGPMIRNKLMTFVLLLNVVSTNALTGKIVLSPELFKGWHFTQSFVFAKEQARYYPVAPDGSFNIPSENKAELTLTTFVPGFNRETETFSGECHGYRHRRYDPDGLNARDQIRCRGP